MESGYQMAPVLGRIVERYEPKWNAIQSRSGQQVLQPGGMSSCEPLHPRRRCLTGRSRMFLQVRFYKRANRHDLELIEVSKVQRSANQLVSQTASPIRRRDLGMDK